MSGLNLLNTKDVTANNVYVNYDGNIRNILELFSKKNDITNNTNDFNEQLNLKAPINSPTFTGTVSGITKHMIGLGNVNNSTDLNKPISNATQTALNLKADSDDTYTKTEVDNNIKTRFTSCFITTGTNRTLKWKSYQAFTIWK